MSVDPTQLNQPAASQFSSGQGQVAPSPTGQNQAQTPGASPQAPGGQPATQPQGRVAPEAQPASPPQVQQPQIDPVRLREQQELAQYKQAMGQLQAFAEQQQRDQQFDQELTMLLATAENMPTSDANTYLRNQTKQLIARERQRASQALQQTEMTYQQQMQMLAAPMYADYLIENTGLPPEAKEELLALGDPNLMQRQAPVIKARYDRWNQQFGQIQQNQVQVARSQEVAAATQAGLGAFGGQVAGGSFQIEVPDDPDERALAILAATEGRPGNYKLVGS